ncbi:MAG: GAF domain-containing sensor histidine kinase [Candidatus Dormibacteria bacterium]
MERVLRRLTEGPRAAAAPSAVLAPGSAPAPMDVPAPMAPPAPQVIEEPPPATWTVPPSATLWRYPPGATAGTPPAAVQLDRSSVGGVLYALVAKATEMVDADLCQVFILQEGSLVLRAEAPGTVARTIGFASVPPGPAQPSALQPNSLLLVQVVSTGTALDVGELDGLEGPERAWWERGLRRLAAVGLGSVDPRSGLLVVGRVRDVPFDPDELAILTNLAVETSLALASADLVSRAEELAVLRERVKLARDIHDGLASDLSAVVSLFKYFDQRRQTDPEDAERILDQMRELAEGSLQSARDILATLRPRSNLTRQIGEAVRRQTDDFARTYGVSSMVSVLGDDADLANEERDAVYMVLREALTNIRKHANASGVEVMLDMRQRPFVLEVEDDGAGIPNGGGEEKVGSFGLVGMRERAALIGGLLEVTAGTKRGTRVILRGPVGPGSRS